MIDFLTRLIVIDAVAHSAWAVRVIDTAGFDRTFVSGGDEICQNFEEKPLLSLSVVSSWDALSLSLSTDSFWTRRRSRRSS